MYCLIDTPPNLTLICGSARLLSAIVRDTCFEVTARALEKLGAADLRDAILNLMADSSARLVIHLVSSGGYYGAERVIVELSHYLNSQGWRSVIYALDSAGNPSLVDIARSQGIEVVGASTRRFTTQRQELALLVRNSSCALVHSHGYKSDLLLAVTPLPSRVRRIATCHGWINLGLKLRFYGWVGKVALLRFDRVVAVSQRIARELLRWRVPASRVQLIWNGVDVSEAAPEARSRIRANLGIPAESKLLLQVGRLDRLKGYEESLQALALLRKGRYQVDLIVAGTGPDRSRLESLAGELGVSAHVHWLGYWSQTSDLFATANLFVISSRSEGLPITLLEAMAAGCPIVSTSVGEIPLVLDHGRLGQLVDAGDARALARTIADLLSSPALRAKMAADALESYRAHFSRNAMGSAYVRLYDAVSR